MPLTPNFSAAQNVGEPSVVELTDTSTGSDGTITERRVYFQNSQGGYVVTEGNSEDYEVWPLADTTKEFDLLSKDMALNITVNWVNSGGATVQTKTSLCGFTLYNRTFLYALTQSQASQNTISPLIIQDTEFYANKLKMMTEMDSGDQAIEVGDDIVSAQGCYDRATYFRLKEATFFGQ